MGKIGEMQRIVLSSYHYIEKSALKEDIENDYEVVTKRKFADYVM